MVTGVTATVQFLHSNQGHVLRSDSWAGFSRPKEDAVEATSADVRHSLIAVCFGVPGVSAVFLFAQLFPHITHTWRQTSHLYNLRRSETIFRNWSWLSLYFNSSIIFGATVIVSPVLPSQITLQITLGSFCEPLTTCIINAIHNFTDMD